MTSVSGLSSVFSSAAPITTTTTASPFGVSTEGFLKLLVAQSQHQDPLSPKDPADTLLQLAALAEVSSLQDIKTTLAQLLASQQMSAGLSASATTWTPIERVPTAHAVPVTETL